MKVAVQIDPLDKIKFQSDSTISLIREALKRNFQVWYYHTPDLFMDNKKVSAYCHKIDVLGDDFIRSSESKDIDLSHFEFVLMRQDPPVDMGYLTSTYILENISDSTIILNDPRSVRDCSEKLFALSHFSEFMPPTLVTQDIKKAEIFLKEHDELVLKPLYGCAGQDIIKCNKGNIKKFHTDFERLVREHKTPLMIQKFLPEIRSGDKRIILVDGEMVSAINRIPQKGSVVANMAAGGEAAATSLSDEELSMCNIVGSEMKKRGIIFAGLDVIGGYLTEINVTSPTGIEAANKLYQLKDKDRVESKIWDALEVRLKHLKK